MILVVYVQKTIDARVAVNGGHRRPKAVGGIGPQARSFQDIYHQNHFTENGNYADKKRWRTKWDLHLNK